MSTAAIWGLGHARSASVAIDAQRDRLLQLQLLLQSCTQGDAPPRLAEVAAGVKDVFNALEAPIERLISCLKLANSDVTFVAKIIEFDQTAADSLPTCLTLIEYRRPIAGTGSHHMCFNDEAARKQQLLDSDASFASKVVSLSGSQVLDKLLAVRLPATAATTADAFIRILVALASVCVLQEHLLKRCLHLLADPGHSAPECGAEQGSSNRMDESCSHLLERACTLANHIVTHMDVAAAALSKSSGLP